MRETIAVLLTTAALVAGVAFVLFGVLTLVIAAVEFILCKPKAGLLPLLVGAACVFFGASLL